MKVAMRHARTAVDAQQGPARATLADDPEAGLVTPRGRIALSGWF